MVGTGMYWDHLQRCFIRATELGIETFLGVFRQLIPVTAQIFEDQSG